MYVVVVWGRNIDRFIVDWRSHFKYRIPKEIRENILVEKRIGKTTYMIVVEETLWGLWLCRKLKRIADKHGVGITISESRRIDIDNEHYIDEKIKEWIKYIPPEHVYEIKKSIINAKLPRRKEIIEVMK